MKKLLGPLVLLAISTAGHAAEALKMRPLFNGRDLDGWTGEGYRVEDGTLVSTTGGKTLMTERTFSAYVLEFDFKLPAGGNNGLCIHYPGSGDGASSGMEIQILDNADPKNADLKDTRLNGSLLSLAAAKKSGLKPTGEWNHERVTVAGPDLHVELNGGEILHANLDDVSTAHPDHEGAKLRCGHIGLLGHGDQTAFRNIMIAELAPAANTEGVIAAGFQPLLKGDTLDGWKTGDATAWQSANGILSYNGHLNGQPALWSEKSYRDFTLVFDWRWSGPQSAAADDPSGGIFLRGPGDRQVHFSSGKSGTVDPAEPPKITADRPFGEWNRAMITLKGGRVSVVLNGWAVVENAPVQDLPNAGPVGLHANGAPLDFANLWIKEL